MSKKIVIDSGHGGEDGGASGNGIIEKDLTLKENISLPLEIQNIKAKKRKELLNKVIMNRMTVKQLDDEIAFLTGNLHLRMILMKFSILQKQIRHTFFQTSIR